MPKGAALELEQFDADEKALKIQGNWNKVRTVFLQAGGVSARSLAEAARLRRTWLDVLRSIRRNGRRPSTTPMTARLRSTD